MGAESSFPLPRPQIEAALARRVAADAEFGKFLREDPKAALSAHLGVELPEWLEVDLVEERPDRMVIVLPVDLTPFRRPTIDAMIGRAPRPRASPGGGSAPAPGAQGPPPAAAP